MVWLNRRSHEIDMCSGPLLSKMMVFAVPVIITSVLQIMYNAADMIVVGRFASENALASVGATSQLINLLVGFFNGISVGASVVVARQFGADDRTGVGETTHTALTMSLLCGALITVVSLCAADGMLELMDTPEDVIGGASLYLRIYFVGVPAMMVYNFAAAILRAVGDTRRPMYFLIVSGAVNVVLNLVFVIGCGMDVDGVAWATTVSQYLSAAMIVVCMMRTEGCTRLQLRRLRMHRHCAVEIMRIGLPSGIQTSMFSISNVLIQSGINSFGAAYIAGNSASSSIEGFVSLATAALYQVNLSFVGQNMGAKKYDRIEKINRIGLLLSLLIWVVLGGAVFLLRYPLMRIYTTDAVTIEAGVQKLAVLLAGYFFAGMMNSMVGTLRGMGCATIPMVNTIIFACVFRVIWMYTIFAWYHTWPVIFLSYPVSWALISIAHYVTYLIIRKKLFRPENAA